MFDKWLSDYSHLDSRGELSLADEEGRGFIDGKRLCCEKCHRSFEFTSTGWSFIPRLSVFIPWTIVVISLGLFAHQWLIHPSELACARLLSPYSPVFEDGAVEYHNITYHNMFGNKIELGGPPTPELEQNWRSLWDNGNIELPRKDVEKLGKSTEGLLHAGGNDPERGYVAALEVFHYLHCLNQIRQFTWKEHYATHMAEWIEKDHRHMVDMNVTDPGNALDRMHVDHCIEALRLQLMCAADVVPLLIQVDEGSRSGYMTDFNVNMKCRNYDKIVEWQSAHALEGGF
ncbi:hypothetical protein HD806DRAFT_534903 [Xylariaceae sp. AK1471]|nr:hypothetical protein HD806DRAFT_534903 [Xylariaceae sp. AK1471]